MRQVGVDELREETGERIINGMCDTILSGPLG
jgi:FAD-dependent urate hydroxylase